ncbi:MAG: ATP-binding protein [Acidobacteria bacterium RIFCSPLOWO2_02_FULL_67_36]|nr:MAG: ATP-binding protein [Acidobacteria bacterium RIFCSPLOWO2_02_FULL_67_36]OFW20526.1 MAG: ATP-binding protein [Acidobacteria bacterium RIFCSPLOWO2_12_FULL_66_21]
MKILLSWSTGKDSAWAFHLLNQQYPRAVSALLTTINETVDRVAMHGVRRAIAEAQAASAGLPLWTIPLPHPCANDVYEARMKTAATRAVAEGFTHVAFGDLFLEDVRQYRERQLAGTGLTPLFPVWRLPTAELAARMISSGLRARITCVDTRALPAEFAGREFDRTLLDELPAGVDPCGENGEFHTCVYDGPMFRRALVLETGETVARDGFVWRDVACAGDSLSIR